MPNFNFPSQRPIRHLYTKQGTPKATKWHREGHACNDHLALYAGHECPILEQHLVLGSHYYSRKIHNECPSTNHYYTLLDSRALSSSSFAHLTAYSMVAPNINLLSFYLSKQGMQGMQGHIR
jgi:hypothetical protein